MAEGNSFIHPYIPNSVPEVKAEMLKSIGVEDVEALYQEIPEKLRFKRRLDLPRPFLAESELKKHVMSILLKNKTCEENLNFLGGGCWQHYVPAVCDEIVGRSEVLTAYAGEPYSDLGKFQLLFEYQSQLGELVGMDVVCLPIYSWGTAAGCAVRMASRITGRSEVLVPGTVSPERLATIRTFCQPVIMPGHIEVKLISYDSKTGLLDLEDLENKISPRTAAVYIENPSYLGFIEAQGEKISEIAHTNGALSIVGVDPISLGVLLAPADYGADIVVGTAQPLGIHMNCGGGGEYGFGWSTWDRTSYVVRDDQGQIRSQSKDFIGTSSNLWAIGAAVYMALMGPSGFKEIGELIIQKSHYAIKLLSEVKGVEVIFGPNIFKEFVVNFDGTGKTVKDINKALLGHNIFGGKDISKEFPELGASALYCVTEMHSQDDIKKLTNALRGVLAK